MFRFCIKKLWHDWNAIPTLLSRSHDKPDTCFHEHVSQCMSPFQVFCIWMDTKNVFNCIVFNPLSFIIKFLCIRPLSYPKSLCHWYISLFILISKSNRESTPWKELCTEALHNWYSSPDILEMQSFSLLSCISLHHIDCVYITSGSCGTQMHGRYKKCIQNCSQKSLKKVSTSETRH